jgi:hypothetical protein
MNDAQRYRMNAAECLSAAEGCELPCRGLTLAIAESWLSLARLRHADKRRPIPRRMELLQCSGVNRVPLPRAWRHASLGEPSRDYARGVRLM